MATIVSLHAHPDDEALLTGGWLAQRSAAGDRVVLVFATDGDAGLAGAGYPAGSLAEVRRAEAAASAAALGAARVVWLGYADSGMADRPSRNGRRFAGVPVEEAAREVAAVLAEEQAAVLTGYDANGGYGHPDHVHVHRVARRAQALATTRPALLEATLDRTWLLRAVRAMRPLARLLPGLTLPGDEVFTDRGSVTLAVDVRAQLPEKRAALAAHASQGTGGVRTTRLLLALPRPLARRVLGTEWFVEVPWRPVTSR
ncbi:GlcNAc-PI de-N-acetylase [Nocardioides guangzhouensis]|uniref:GlcNAc-PI de-N-acetylase n=1 Tax=Nocardioides guangzhouensis TaxID=2497878 RepID=A0A4Q4ZA85_9ACTN|nr:PIG-L family deacetylase [Nocardioides guangzhouensis]RYP84004.1 GlcNAc-PI de-N-acetylase [Nocardioides guangzhouensis]